MWLISSFRRRLYLYYVWSDVQAVLLIISFAVGSYDVHDDAWVQAGALATLFLVALPTLYLSVCGLVAYLGLVAPPTWTAFRCTTSNVVCALMPSSGCFL